MVKIKHRLLLKMLLLLPACPLLLPGRVFAQVPQNINATSTLADPAMESHFKIPPHSARPWVFWMWLRVNVDEKAITADLEEMHKKGIEGAILYESGTGYEPGSMTANMVLEGKKYVIKPSADLKGAFQAPLPVPLLNSWDKRTRELFRFAAKEANRIGIKFVLSVGLAGTSGPIDPEYGQQALIWSEKDVVGGTAVNEQLPDPSQTVLAMHESVANSSADYKKKLSRMPAIAKSEFKRHEIAVLAIPDEANVQASQVINISDKMDADGKLQWNAPAGKWKIMRFAYRPTGNHDVWGYFTDGMSAEALDTTWHTTIGKMLKEMTPEERKGLYGVEDDSWEGGETTWTKLFAQKFKEQHHYDLIAWLPAVAGITLGDTTQTDGIRRDYYRTIADLIAANHYGHLRELANQNRLVCYSEAAGPNTSQLDNLKNSNAVDMAMGEYWVPSVHRATPERRFLLRNTATANHVYGKKVTACEGFTSVGPHWEESFFDLKNVADQAFCDGLNLNVFHNFTQSLLVDAKPNYVYFAGTHYSRNVTWWEQTPAFNAYMGRCSYMLQQGLFVADALYYMGDGIGHGEQMKSTPELPAQGYDHDNCNLDVLLHRVSVKNGRLVLPDGMSYKMLVLPNQPKMAYTALQKIAGLINSGAIVVGPQPEGLAGLVLNVDNSIKAKQMISELWSPNAKHHVISNQSPAQVLKDIKLLPDFEYTGLSTTGEIDWIHRRVAGNDIYFVASRWDAKEKINATFRVSGKQPELWDAVTGEMRIAKAFTQSNGRTTVPLAFEPRGSVFVVFRKPIAATAKGTTRSNYASYITKATLKGSWELHFDPKWGGPAKIKIDSLMDWTRFDDYNIKHYSGTAIYNKTFNVAKADVGKKLLLDLGEVHEEAVVKVNGIDLGVVWTKPARIDISKAIHPGENKLEITVVNLWPNRLIGDEPLPQEKRFTQTNIHKFSKDTPLLPSGLIGPVELEEAK
ncbi:glycosyl hydrolase [Mucilaginibacter sp. dw_454]|uniref:glycosyl hydrolase n=1 Tax=Mucilaginibacter sp. dw_454 TaxID=2720079 RepID=UPI001BD60EEC|nr:glycosyl hydrolase [Mucilaginibacter sp. dw_454]